MQRALPVALAPLDGTCAQAAAQQARSATALCVAVAVGDSFGNARAHVERIAAQPEAARLACGDIEASLTATGRIDAETLCPIDRLLPRLD